MERTERIRYWVYTIDKKRIGFSNVKDAKNYILKYRPDAKQKMVAIRKGMQLYGSYMIIGKKLVKIGD